LRLQLDVSDRNADFAAVARAAEQLRIGTVHQASADLVGARPPLILLRDLDAEVKECFVFVALVVIGVLPVCRFARP